MKKKSFSETWHGTVVGPAKEKAKAVTALHAILVSLLTAGLGATATSVQQWEATNAVDKAEKATEATEDVETSAREQDEEILKALSTQAKLLTATGEVLSALEKRVGDRERVLREDLRWMRLRIRDVEAYSPPRTAHLPSPVTATETRRYKGLLRRARQRGPPRFIWKEKQDEGN